MSEKCIFCEIAGDRKTSKVYEDENVICILDINPISKGHCLIIPKRHFIDIFDIDKSTLEDIILSAKEVSMLLKKRLNADGVNILHASGISAQQSVFHFHIHIVPRYKDDNLDTWPKSQYKENSLEEVYQEIKRQQD